MLDLNLFEADRDICGPAKLEETPLKDVAVIGVALRLPMANTPDEFWNLIRDGKCCVADFPEARRADAESLARRLGLAGKYRRCAYLADVDKFDCGFFRISPNEADMMDPNQRQFLQTAFGAVEDAGYGGGKLSGTRTGVYLGYNADAPYGYKNCLSGIEPSALPMALSGNLTSVIPGRLSHILDLRGPSLAVDTACSSSLVAVHLAVRALRSGECDLALAGGIKLDLLPLERDFKLGIESSADLTRTFDDASDGTAMGEGVGAVLLKPLYRAKRDADHIYAVIKGSAANQDGNTIGMTAPSVRAQEEVIAEAWRDAGVDPATAAFVEAHGTGTKLGDPIEIEGLTRAFKKFTDKKQFCAVGSVKTNFGHLDSAAGITGLIKAVLELEKRELAPTLHFDRPNRNIDFCGSPVYVNDRLLSLPDGTLRCGVSAFGLSGTNCHVVLEEAPKPEKIPAEAGPHIFTLSAKSYGAFRRLIEIYREWIKNRTSPDFASICYTSSTGRGHYGLRLAVVAKDTAELADKLNAAAGWDLGSDYLEEDGVFFGARADADKTEASGEGIGGAPGELYDLCRRYVRGADIDWEGLYRGRRIPKLHLPTYSFEQKRCWVKPSAQIPEDRGAKEEPQAEDFSPKVGLSGRSDGEYTKTEELVAAAWAKTLGLGEIDVRSSFYDLGGDSIAAMRVANLIKESSGEAPDLSDVLKYPTVEDFSRHCDEKAPEPEKTAESRIPAAGEREYYPVTPSQRRMYILNQSAKDDLSCNIPAAFLVEGKLDRKRLGDCFSALVKRHSALRTEFAVKNGEPVQKIVGGLPLEIEELHVGPEGIEAAVREFVRPFDVGKAPLLRVGTAQLGEESLLVLDLHHIASDGVSAGILLREFSLLYSGACLPPPGLEYKDYSVWYAGFLESEIVRKQSEYWKKIYSDGVPELSLPCDFARPEKKAYRGGKITETLDVGTAKSLLELSRERKITPNTLFMSLYALLLAGLSGQKKIPVGTVVSGRHHSGTENTVGIFINYLPLLLCVDEAGTFAELFRKTEAALLEAYQNQDYPYDRLAEELCGRPDPARNPLFDTMLVYHNEFRSDSVIEAGGLVFKKLETGAASSTLDLKLDVIEMNDGTLELGLEYNALLFRRETAQSIMYRFRELVSAASGDPERSVSDFFSAKEGGSAAEKPRRAVSLAVASTFTAEPVGDYVKWWCQKFGIEAKVSFAAYNQVFQELLDPSGLLSANAGVNLLLVRFEDWLRDDASGEDEKCEKLEANFTDLLSLLKSGPRRVPLLAAVFPVSPSFGGRVADCLERLTEKWRGELSAMSDVYALDFTALAGLYGISEVYDPIKDREGHLPFGDGYYAAMGTEIARKLCAHLRPPFKAIALDCDNTLWKGVCGEDGALGVAVSGPYAALQRFMLQKYGEGMLLVLLSKNNEADVLEVFEKNPGMILKKEHFAAWRLNWEPKPDNLRAIARELNLGPDSFIFVDDNPAECTEMSAACPEALTLGLPGNAESIPSYLGHVWAFDRLGVTEEDRRRNEMYREEKDRRAFRREMRSLSDFISGLGLKLGMDPMTKEQIPRASQLTFRTNQFNLSGRRRSEEELSALLDAEGFSCFALRSRDRFGDYGLIGVLIAEEDGGTLKIDTFLLSCRVLGRGVEAAVLSALGEYCRGRGVTRLEADYRPTEKNRPALDFFEKTGWEKAEVFSDRTVFSLSAEKIPAVPPYVGRYVAGESRGAAPRLDVKDAMDPPSGSFKSAEAGEDDWAAPENGAKQLHACDYATIEYRTAEKLLRLPLPRAALAQSADYAPPENETQQRLADIWSDVLMLDRVGIDDDFFKSGGHSLRAAVLVSRIYKAFGVDVGLRDIFSHPTVRKLAELIYGAKKAGDMAIRPLERRESYPVSSVQRRLYILNRMDEKSTGYNITAAFELYGEPDADRLEKAFCDLIKRHEAFRTSFEERGGEPVQIISDAAAFELVRADVFERPVDQVIREFICPFDLKEAPLIRAELVRRGRGSYVLVIDTHHIVSDGTSTAILIGELSALYSGRKLAPLKVHYKDFAAWQNGFFATERYRKEEKYWLKVFADGVPLLELPTDCPRPAVRRFGGARLFFGAGEKLSQRLKAAADGENCTSFMLLLAAFNVLLMKYSASEDIAVGAPIAGRRSPDTENLIGMFVNTVVMRNRPCGMKSFREFLAEVKENTLLAAENGDYQFEDLVERLDCRSAQNRNPLYDAAFEMLDMDVRAEAAGIEFAPHSFETGVSKVDITLAAVERDDGYGFELEYSTELFGARTAERLKNGYLRILEAVAEDRNVLLRNIELEKLDFGDRDGIEKVDFAFEDLKI